MSVRLKDLAEDLGVSIVSVSKALRNHPDIPKHTRDRILKRVKELNYRPNLMARSLVTGRSSLIGMVVPDLVHPFFGEIAKSLSDTLRKRDFFLIVASSQSDPVLERAEIDQMLAHRVDAIVVASSQAEASHLSQLNAPLILLDRIVPGLAASFVGSDDGKVGALTTEYLISIGRKRIAHIAGPTNSVGDARLNAYRKSLQSRGMKLRDDYVVQPEDGATDITGYEYGQRAARKLLALQPSPDAIFCFNDLVATGAMMATLELGKRIPEDVALIGCGNYNYGHTLRVPLSSVEQQITEFGVRIAKMIFSMLNSKATMKPKIVLLEPSLVLRASTGQPPAKTGTRNTISPSPHANSSDRPWSIHT